MQLSQQVTSLETSKRLKELGVKQESLFYHYQQFINGQETWDVFPSKVYEFCKWEDNDSVHRALNGDSKNQVYSAFTVAELGMLLPDIYSEWTWFTLRNAGKEQDGIDKEDNWTVHYYDNYTEPIILNEYPCYPTEAEARATLLIHLLQNNLLDNEK